MRQNISTQSRLDIFTYVPVEYSFSKNFVEDLDQFKLFQEYIFLKESIAFNSSRRRLIKRWNLCRMIGIYWRLDLAINLQIRPSHALAKMEALEVPVDPLTSQQFSKITKNWLTTDPKFFCAIVSKFELVSEIVFYFLFKDKRSQNHYLKTLLWAIAM